MTILNKVARYLANLFSLSLLLSFIWILLQATKTWKESTLSKIVQLTEEAQLNKPKLQRWLDEFGEHYSKVVVVLSIAVAVIGPFFFKWPFISTSGNLEEVLVSTVCDGGIYFTGCFLCSIDDHSFQVNVNVDLCHRGCLRASSNLVSQPS